MNFMDIMTIKNYNKFGGSIYFAFFSLSLFLMLAFFSSNISNVIANLDSNSTLTNSNSTLTNSNSTLTNSNSTLTNSNSIENKLNGIIHSFTSAIDGDRRHMPVI